MVHELKKIVLVGPVYPYKGGISHYTGLLYNALKKKYDVKMISYELQYPKVLFKKEQKDFSNDLFKINDTLFLLNTAIPSNWIKTARFIKDLEPDLVIIQWWHPYFAPCYWFLCKMMKNIKIMFVCHNVFPHERFPLDRFLTKLVLNRGDYFITHSGLDAKDLLSIKEDVNYTQAVLPTYNVFKFENMDKSYARKILGLNAEENVLLFFGLVREYKGLKYLLKALPFVKENLQDTKLLIVGDFGNSKLEYMNLIEQLQIGSMIEICDEYVPDKEVEKYFAACDLVVLPYESATQSAVVQIAYGFEKPVIVTNVGGLPEVVRDGETGFVVQARNPKELGWAIVKYFSEKNHEKFRKNIEEEAYRYSWDRMVEHVEKLYASVKE